MSALANNSLISRAYEILNEMKAGRTTDDERIHIRMIIRAIRTAYGKVLQEYLDQKNKEDERIDESMYISYCVNTRDAREFSVYNLVLRDGHIPDVAYIGGVPAIKVVYTSGKEATMQMASGFIDAKTKASGGVWSSKTPSFYIENKKINALFPKRLLPYDKSLHVVMLPKDIMDTGTDECYDIWSEDFPINPFLWAKVKEYVIRFDIQVMNGGAESIDFSNDSNASNSFFKKLQWAFKS